MGRILCVACVSMLALCQTRESRAQGQPPVERAVPAPAEAPASPTVDTPAQQLAAPSEPVAVVEKPSSNRLEALGSYERSAVRLALEKRKLELEDAPEGRVLGKIHVYNLAVFGRAEGFLRLINFLHITTREQVIRREVLMDPGELWDQDLVDETQRAIKDPLFTSLVVVLPVRNADPSKFDLLVVTRDIWSLRMNSTFEYLQGTVTGLRLSVAENNILGLRKHGAFAFNMGQGNFTLGPQFVDKAVLGTRLQLSAVANLIFSRKSQEFEGTSSDFNLTYPLWSLRQKWGAGLSMSHFDSTIRFFRGTKLEPYDNPDTDEIETIDRTYHFTTLGTEASGVRSFGTKIKHRVSLGHALSVRRPSFVFDFSGTDADRVAFERDVFPRSERASSLFVKYLLFTPRYVVYRNLSSYDLAEDVRLGPQISVGTSAALKVIGSERNFYRANLSAAYVLDLAGDGFLRVASAASTRLQEKEFIDSVVTSEAKIATPRIGNTFRLVAQARIDALLREGNNGRLALGGESGLRGYVISEFTGQRRIMTNVELRSMPVKVLFTRVGGLLFWDMGHAADTLGDLRPKHDLGFGLRPLIPQLQAIVFRLDWAIPLQGNEAGFPGRISAGVAQVF